jgi:hypothetical protein
MSVSKIVPKPINANMAALVSSKAATINFAVAPINRNATPDIIAR